jgi:hypothetical protein
MHFMSHLRNSIACALTALGICAAQADHAPALVVPGRADIPVMINGYDASWGVVEGDWGLYRPGFVSPTVIPAPIAAPLLPARRYFPSLGAAPHSGRYEIEPPANRALPRPAPTYHREWSSSSDMSAPATINETPPVISAGPDDQGYGPSDMRGGSRFSGHRRHHHRHHHH